MKLTSADKQKRVLFIVPSLMRGGMENMLVNISNIFSEWADVSIYNLGSHDESMVMALNSSIKYYSLWNPCKNIKNCGWDNIIHGDFRVLPGALWYKLHSGKYIHKKIVRENFDVEIAFFVGEPFRIVSGAGKNVRKIAWIHNDYIRCSGLFNSFSSKNAAIKAMKTFDKVVCVSQNAENAFKETTGISDKSVVVYNYLPCRVIKDKALEPVGIQKEKMQFVAVGRLVYAKGFDRLLSVVRRLNNEGFTFGLWIVGDGSERAALEKYCDAHKLDNVVLLGNMENPYPYIALADLLICSSRYEGYNLTVAEAVVLRTPVLSTECTGPTEILDNGKYGMIVDNDENGIYEGLKKILTHPDLLGYYSARAVERYLFADEENIQNQLYTVIQGERR